MKLLLLNQAKLVFLQVMRGQPNQGIRHSCQEGCGVLGWATVSQWGVISPQMEFLLPGLLFQARERETPREIYLLIHFLNGHKDLGWTRPKQRAYLGLGFPRGLQGTSSTAFHISRELDWKQGSWELKLVPI